MQQPALACQSNHANSTVGINPNHHCASPCNVILGHSSSGNHDCCWVLDLHLSEENVAVLCQLDVCRFSSFHFAADRISRAAKVEHRCSVITLLTSSATNKHLDGALWPEVGFHNIMQSFRCVDVHEQSCAPAHDLGLGVQCFYGRHVDADYTPRPAC